MHVLLLDLYHRGHHRSYIEIMCRHWTETRQEGQLTVLVPREFSDFHPDFKGWIDSLSKRGVRLVELRGDYASFDPNTGVSGLLAANRAHKAALREAVALEPDHIVCMFFDHAQLAIGGLSQTRSGKKVKVSGILFRPTLHEKPSSLKTRISLYRKKMVLKRALRSSALHALFCLDPRVIEPINVLAGQRVARWLPDGTAFPPPEGSATDLRQRYDIKPGSRILLLFGALSARKGVHHVLDALPMLPEETRKNVVLLMVGKVEAGEEWAIKEHVASANKKVRVILDDSFVSDGLMASLFAFSDVVLVSYERHVGSSGMLIRAAHAGKPVVGSDYGLVGHNIKLHKLGLALDTSSPEALSTAISQVLSQDESVVDSVKMRAFAGLNTEAKFAETILGSLTT